MPDIGRETARSSLPNLSFPEIRRGRYRIPLASKEKPAFDREPLESSIEEPREREMTAENAPYTLPESVRYTPFAIAASHAILSR